MPDAASSSGTGRPTASAGPATSDTSPRERDERPYAAPARRKDLTGLAPAWIGVGSLDLFHDEDVAYAERLRAAGVDCWLHVVPGMYHGADGLFAKTGTMKEFGREFLDALRGALG